MNTLNISRRSFLQACLLTSFTFLLPRKSSASTTVISSLPFDITESGSYVLNQDLNVSLATGAAIRILAPNVTIDFQENSITNTYGDMNRAAGIATDAFSYISISNGTISNFHSGVYTSPYNDTSQGIQVKDITVQDFYATGLYISGGSSVVANCTISTMLEASDIVNNECIGRAGIIISKSRAGYILKDNTIDMHDDSHSGRTTCIYLADIDEGYVLRNSLSNSFGGIVTGATGGPEFKSNTSHNVYVPFVGGINRGDNIST